MDSAGLITIVSAWDWLCRVGLASFAVIVKVLLPCKLGIPKIIPEPGCNASPGGSEPAVRLQVYGRVPPAAFNWTL